MFECYNADFRATKRNCILPNNKERCLDIFDHLLWDLCDLEEQLMFMENRRSQYKCNTEWEWLSVRVRRRFIYILYIYIFTEVIVIASQIIAMQSERSASGHFVDTDIFWHWGLQSGETLLIPLKIMFIIGRFKIHQYRSLLSRSSILCFSLDIAYSISGQCKGKMCSLDMNLIESDMAGY